MLIFLRIIQTHNADNTSLHSGSPACDIIAHLYGYCLRCAETVPSNISAITTARVGSACLRLFKLFGISE